MMKMNYMKKILEQMRTRPRMYLGDHKIGNLSAYITGYMYRLFQEEDTIPEFYPGFQEYIEIKYNVTTGQHWSKILDFYSDSEEEALKKFFQHLDEYTKMDEDGGKNS